MGTDDDIIRNGTLGKLAAWLWRYELVLGKFRIRALVFVLLLILLAFIAGAILL